MRKITLLVALLYSLTGFCQQHQFGNKPYIAVTGSAEMEIVPDIIYISFTAKEYKEGNSDVKLQEIHKNILNVIQGFGIDNKDLQIEDFYGNRWISKRQIKDLVASKKYILKIIQMDNLDKILDKLDSVNVQEIHLEEITHSKLEEFKEQVKIQATQAAKKKASAMALGLEQTLGKAFEVIEKDFEPINYYNYYEGKDKDEVYNYRSSSSSLNQDSKINFKTISLSYEVIVKFELL
jgi:uncharacterized protein